MNTITLTFDNGPDPDVTPLVLDTLVRHAIRSTFFVLGHKLRDHRALAERAHAEGHWIGNHTFNHRLPLGLLTEPGAAVAEITDTEDLIGALADRRRLFRPFGNGGIIDRHLLNAEALAHLMNGRYTCVLWNVIARDWVEPETWVERALALCSAKREALVVLHDLPTGAMNHLERFIDAARERGASFVQKFPASCVPIERGHLQMPVDPYVTRPVNVGP
jgi:peptidoglycan-N-acetylglucosamine deacetylase